MPRSNAIINDLTEGSVAKKLLTFAAPFMLSNLLQVAYNLIDMVIVGQEIGQSGLAAVANGGDVLHMLTFFSMGFSSAGQIIISQYVGMKEHERISRTVGTMFTFTTLLALAFAIIGFFTIDLMLNLLNIPEESWAQAKEYSIVCFFGLVFIFGYNLVSAILRGMGDSKRPFYFIAAAAVMNLILDLVFVPVMGVMGAALATALAQAASYIGSLVYLYIRRESFGFDFKLRSFRMDGEIIRHMLRLGLPMALQHSAISISRMFVNSCINAYGVTAAAVNGTGHKISQAASIVSQALSTAGTAMIGQNFGAGKKDRIEKLVYLMMFYGLVFTSLLSLASVLFPEQIFSVFSTDSAVLKMSHDYSIILVLQFIGAALRSPMMGLINGLGNAKLAFLLGLLDGFIARVGLAYLMGYALNMQLMGFWYGDALAGFVPFIIGGIYFWTGLWRKKKLDLAPGRGNT